MTRRGVALRSSSRRQPAGLVVGVLLALAGIAGGSIGATWASFSSEARNPENSFATATLAPPSDLTVRRTCEQSSTVGVRSSTSGSGSAGSLSIARPSGVASGDVLLAQVAIRTGAATSVAAPEGWSSIRQDAAGTQVLQALYLKVAGASEPSSYTWTSASTGRAAGGIVAYTGVNQSNPVDAHAGGTGAVANMDAPSIRTETPNTRLVAAYALRQVTMTLPSGMSSRWNLNSGGGSGSVTVGVADEAFVGPGATGDRRATSSNVGFDWVAQLVALRPEATARASLSWTATPSSFAEGYRLQRWQGEALQVDRTLTPRTKTSESDGPVVTGESYTYRLAAVSGDWRSAWTSVTFTPTAC